MRRQYVHFLCGNYPLAISAFETSAKLDPTNRRTWNNLGMALARVGEPARSSEAFARALEVVPVAVAKAEGDPASGSTRADSSAAERAAQATAESSLAAVEPREGLAVPKDRGVIAPAARIAEVAAANMPARAADSAVAEVNTASPAISVKLDSRPLPDAIPPGTLVTPNTELVRVESPVVVPVHTSKGGDVSEMSVGDGLAEANSIKIIPEMAQIELRQVAPQVFELRTGDVTPSLIRPPLTADLPTRYRELQEMSASARHIEVAIADEVKAGVNSDDRSSQRQTMKAQQPHVRLAAASAASSARPLKVGDFYARVEAARTPRRAMRFFRLELANGIGIKGFARRMNEMLVAKGAPSSVLSDHRPFRQVRTEIQYRDGYASAANALSRRMTVRPAVVKSEGLPLRTDVRIVLGRDLVHKFALRDDASSEWLLSEAALRFVLAEVFRKG